MANMKRASSKMPLPPADLPVDRDLIGIGINFHNPDGLRLPYLTKIKVGSQTAWSLTEAVTQFWKLDHPSNYALLSDDRYIRETDDLSWLKSGVVLTLGPSALAITKKVLDAFTSPVANDTTPATSEVVDGEPASLTYARSESLISVVQGPVIQSVPELDILPKKCADPVFAEVFIREAGHTTLLFAVKDNRIPNKETLAKILRCICVLYEQGIVPISEWPDGFVKRLVSLVAKPTEHPPVLQWVLCNIEAFVSCEGEAGWQRVIERLSFRDLEVPLACSSSPLVQLSAVSLINTLLSEAPLGADDRERIRNMYDVVRLRFFPTIYKEIIRDSPASLKREGMEDALFRLQCLSLNAYRERMLSAALVSDPEAAGRINELRELLPLGDAKSRDDIRCSSPRSSTKDAFRALGFVHDINPLLDFQETPPGVLALDCVYHFVKNFPEQFSNIMWENACREDTGRFCPFAKASIRLVRALVEVLGIGQSSDDEGCGLQPMLFTLGNPVEELFSVCIVKLNDTWRLMRAGTEDLGTVLTVVREQVTRALARKPTAQSMQEFRAELDALTYERIKELWDDEEKERMERERKSQPVRELRNLLASEIKKIIGEQRLRYLIEEGEVFPYISRENGKRKLVKDQVCFWSLAEHKKCLRYSEPFQRRDSLRRPSLESLPHKLWFSDCSDIVIGKDCPLIQEFPKRFQGTHSFAILVNDEIQYFHFIAKDQLTFDYWIDGLRVAMGRSNAMNSSEFGQDLDQLLRMDIEMRLLETEGAAVIPDQSPSIPDLPDSLEWCPL